VIKGRLSRAAAYLAAAGIIAATLMMAHPATAQQKTGADEAQVDPGKATYASKCSHCHGFNMVNAGTIAPDLRRLPDDRERFVTTVKAGKNGRMPPWGDILSDDQIESLWAYVSSLRNP
jgi:mono/diheme cytochrome c family protein